METDRGATGPDSPPDFPKHHPAGLWVLFTTEMWERFCYYGMRAFLVLYLCSKATLENNPGFGWTQAEAYHFYGYFTGLVYLMPLLCGWVADRFIGQHRSMVFGGTLIALGEFCLCATEFMRQGAGVAVTYKTDPLGLLTFFSGLALIIIGTGFFKPCVSVMVGQLYGEGDPRRDGGFTIFYMGINIGAFFSPLIAGTIAEKIGWEWGFFTAGIGMIFGLITYSLFRPKYLAHLGLPPKQAAEQLENNPMLQEKAKRDEFERTRPLTAVDLDKVYVILAMSLFTIAFWLSFEQAGSSLNVFAKNSTNRNVGFHESIPQLIRSQAILENEFSDDLDGEINDLETIQNRIADFHRTEEQQKEEKTIPRIGPFGKLARFFSEKKEADTEKTSKIEDRVAELLKKAALLDHEQALSVDAAGNLVLLTPSSEDSQADSKPSEGAEPLFVLSGDNLSGKESPELEKFLQASGAKFSEEEIKELTALLSEYREAKADLVRAVNQTHEKFKPGQNTYTFPATWYQSVNAMGIVVFAPIFAFLWVFLAARNIQPSTPVKFGIGLLLVALSFVVMIPGAIEAKNSLSGANPGWLVLSYVLATWGELCVSPVGLSMVSKLAPIRFASLLMGFWFISSAIANWLGGYLAAIFGSESADGLGFSLLFGGSGGMADFFLLMAIIPAATGVIVLLFASKLKKMMHGVQ